MFTQNAVKDDVKTSTPKKVVFDTLAASQWANLCTACFEVMFNRVYVEIMIVNVI